MTHPNTSEEAESPRSDGMAAMLRRGAAISAVGFLLVQAVSLIQSLVLARVLSPAEIGAFTAGTVLSGLLPMFTEGNLANALIQFRVNKPGELETAANTVFWATLATGTVIGLLSLAAAPLVALVFDSHIAGIIAAITAGTVTLHALTVVPDALMQRAFNFKRRLIVNPCCTLGFAVPAIALAAAGFGVWAMVIATYSAQLVWIVLVWTLSGWRPGRARPSFALWRRMARFALPLTIGDLALHTRDTLEIVIVGRAGGEAALGQYRYGRRLSLIPGTAVVEIAAYVLLPAFARIAGDPPRFRAAYLRALTWVWLAAALTAAVSVAFGESAVVLLLGDRWREAGIAFACLAGYGLGQAMESVAREAIKGSGRSHLLNWTTAVSLVSAALLALTLVGPLGLIGVALAVSIASILMGVVGIGLSAGVVGTTAKPVLRLMVPPVIAGLVCIAVFLPLEHLVVHSDRLGWLGFGTLAAQTIALVVVYLAALRILMPDCVRQLASAVRSRIRGRAAVVEPESSENLKG